MTKLSVLSDCVKNILGESVNNTLPPADQNSVFFPPYFQVVVLTSVLQIQPPLHSLLLRLLNVLTFQSMMIH